MKIEKYLSRATITVTVSNALFFCFLLVYLIAQAGAIWTSDNIEDFYSTRIDYLVVGFAMSLILNILLLVSYTVYYINAIRQGVLLKSFNVTMATVGLSLAGSVVFFILFLVLLFWG